MKLGTWKRSKNNNTAKQPGSLSKRNIRWSQCYFIIPIIGSIPWFGMLVAMLAYWTAQGKPVYAFMNSSGQNPVYISDIGATQIRPLFISCAAWQGLFYSLTLVTEYLLRRSGKLQFWFKKDERNLMFASLVFAIIGNLGVLFCSIFSIKMHHTAHDFMVGVFIIGLFISLVLMMLQYLMMGIHYKKIHVQHKTFNKFIISFIVTLFWTCCAAVFAICFVAVSDSHTNASFEWTLAFWYTLLFWIFAWNLYPAAKKVHKNYPYIQNYDEYYMYHEKFHPEKDGKLATFEERNGSNDQDYGTLVHQTSSSDDVDNARRVEGDFTDGELNQYPIPNQQGQNTYPIPDGHQVPLYPPVDLKDTQETSSYVKGKGKCTIM